MFKPTTFNSSAKGLGKILGELEAHILEALWQESPVSVGAVRKSVEASYKPISYNAVMTVLNRLIPKKLVKKKKVDGVFRYAPVQSKEALEQSVAGSMLGALVNDPALFAAAKFDGLAESVDKDTLAKLKAFIDQAER